MKRKGFAIIAAVFLLIVLSALGLFAVSLLSTDTDIALESVSADEAFYIAEAGLQYVMYKLTDDASFRDNPTPVTKNFGSGSFTVTVSKVGNTYTLTSTADIGDIRRVIAQSVVVSEAPQAFQYGLYADNSDINLTSIANLKINGDLAASGTINIPSYLLDSVNGTIEEYTDLPTVVVDYNYYQSIADTVVTGDQVFSSVTYNGVWYVDGNATITAGADIDGTVVATGNIEIVSSSTINIIADAGMPALVSQNNISGQSVSNLNITGLVYAGTEIDFYAMADIDLIGAFIAGGNIAFDGISSINCDWDPALLLGLPGFSEEGGGSGLVTLAPQKDWDEQ